jgi:hypothetical protein
MMYKMVSDDEVQAFRRYVLTTPLHEQPNPSNWPPPRSPSGAFDSNVPWARFRRRAHDQAPAYQSTKYGATGADLCQKIKDGMALHGGTMQLSDDEISELERALMPESATDASETEAEKEKLRREDEEGGLSVEPDPYAEAKDFMRRKGMSEDAIDAVVEMMPRPGTESGVGGRLAPVNKMASDALERRMGRLYGQHFAEIMGEAPRSQPAPVSSSSALADKMAKLYPGFENIRTY